MIKAFSGTAAGTGTGLTRGAARLSAAHSRKGPLGSGPLPPVSLALALALAPSVGRSMDPCRAIISLEEQEADGSGRLPMDPSIGGNLVGSWPEEKVGAWCRGRSGLLENKRGASVWVETGIRQLGTKVS